MATISKRLEVLETKSTGAAALVLTIIRKIVHKNTPEGGTWVAKFDPVESPDKVASQEILSEPGESEEDFRCRVQELARVHRKRNAPIRIFMTNLDAQL